jgi:hypothetical protein
LEKRNPAGFQHPVSFGRNRNLDTLSGYERRWIVKIIGARVWNRVLAVAVTTCILPGSLINGSTVQAQEGGQTLPDQGQTQGETQTGTQTASEQAQAAAAKQEEARNKAKAWREQIFAQCHVNERETDFKEINKHVECVARAERILMRKIMLEESLEASLEHAFGAPRQPALPETEPPSGPTSGSATNVGGAASTTPSTCGAGSGNNNPLIRVHRMLMAPKIASDDFGHRLGRRYIIYQVTISNDNKDFQFLIHDVTVDLSTLYNSPPGSYLYSASSQDLTLLRGVPEKGQDLDPRNLTLHVLQGVGSVAGGVSGLTPFSGTMGPAVAVFNGAFLQSLIGIAPDHTGTQLNRLSDSAYITNTIVDKQRAKTIAIFVPEATTLSKSEQKEYWKDPYSFIKTPMRNLDQADVCVDGAFITTLAPPTLTKAALTPQVAGTTLAPTVAATLTVQGTNLVAGDTLVIGLGPSLPLTTATGTSGSVNLILPANYVAAGLPVHLVSTANPSITSATITTTLGP